MYRLGQKVQFLKDCSTYSAEKVEMLWVKVLVMAKRLRSFDAILVHARGLNIWEYSTLQKFAVCKVPGKGLKVSDQILNKFLAPKSTKRQFFTGIGCQLNIYCYGIEKLQDLFKSSFVLSLSLRSVLCNRFEISLFNVVKLHSTHNTEGKVS